MSEPLDRIRQQATLLVAHLERGGSQDIRAVRQLAAGIAHDAELAELGAGLEASPEDGRHGVSLDAGREPYSRLSLRELQLILLAGQGLTDKETGRALRISPATVSTMWARLRAKLSINSRPAAVAVIFSTIARICCRWPAAEDLPGQAWQVARDCLLMTASGVVLAAGERVATQFEVRPGLTISESLLGDQRICTFEADTPLRGLKPWDQALESARGSSSRAGWLGESKQPFMIDSLVLDAPLLGRCLVLTVRKSGSEAVSAMSGNSSHA